MLVWGNETTHWARRRVVVFILVPKTWFRLRRGHTMATLTIYQEVDAPHVVDVTSPPSPISRRTIWIAVCLRFLLYFCRLGFN